jgi:hypothetical protein
MTNNEVCRYVICFILRLIYHPYVSVKQWRRKQYVPPKRWLYTYEFIRRYNPEDQHRHIHRRENLKSHMPASLLIVYTP